MKRRRFFSSQEPSTIITHFVFLILFLHKLQKGSVFFTFLPLAYIIKAMSKFYPLMPTAGPQLMLSSSPSLLQLESHPVFLGGASERLSLYKATVLFSAFVP